MHKTTSEIRKSFLDYFESREHLVLPSGPLVPANDPTLMFANAGMVQFKNVFTGGQKRKAPRAATVQKCIRISGKHNDLENVGRTSRHHTFFEMLGNFSFGDYFKREACAFGWGFLTEVMGLEKDRLWVSVFDGDENAPGDDEAAAIWTQELGVPAGRVLRGTAKDNFWAMGDTGPCGPCSEIMYDRGEAFGEASLENGERFFELWNLVFMQYMLEAPGAPMKPLPAPCIDTGAGLERIVSVMQGVDTNYDIDLFRPLIEVGAEIGGVQYGKDPEKDISVRVVADHARMAAHLISEGIFPDKTGREYVLRRVMRRAIRHGHRLGIGDLFFHRVADRVVDVMGDGYPELREHRDLIGRVCRQEEERFRTTLGKGLDLLAGNREWMEAPGGGKMLPGAIAFDLSATYGFPLDLVEVIGEDEGFVVDQAGFEAANVKHKAASGAGKIGEEAVAPVFDELHRRLGDTAFEGYEKYQVETVVKGIIIGGISVEACNSGQDAALILESTPFYGESGGQVGDTGSISCKGGSFVVDGTGRPTAGLFVHMGRCESGKIALGDAVIASVDPERRKSIARHHTATHLLHAALRTVLGPHATQKGSRVAPDLLRFDFSHFEPITLAEIRELERLVAEQIRANEEVVTTVTGYEDAKKSGAMAIFEEHYGDVVRLVEVGHGSKELCGGTHCLRSGDIGAFHIVSETGIAAGVRRIEAVAGEAAVTWGAGRLDIMERAAAALKINPDLIGDKVEKLLAREKELTREIDKLKRQLAAGGGTNILDGVRDVGGVKVLGAMIPVGDPGALRDSADQLRQKMGSGVVCLGGVNKDNAAIVVAVSKDICERLNANALIREVAVFVGGKGGGRPDLAQAGGPNVEGLEEAVEHIHSAVEKLLGTQK